MKAKPSEWLFRYGPAEIAAKLAAVGVSWSVMILSSNLVLSAYAGTIAENTGYYLTIIGRDTRKKIRFHRRRGTEYGFKDVVIHARDLVIEFGPGELLDTLIVRPLAMAVFPLMIPHYGIAVLAASLAADIFFYIPTVIMYELKKHGLKKKQ